MLLGKKGEDFPASPRNQEISWRTSTYLKDVLGTNLGRNLEMGTIIEFQL